MGGARFRSPCCTSARSHRTRRAAHRAARRRGELRSAVETRVPSYKKKKVTVFESVRESLLPFPERLPTLKILNATSTFA
jgi:hypothetical protein